MQRYGHFFVTSQHSTVTANIMLLFPNAKINIGLHIGHTRPDGYHDIATAMVPVHWCDILEILPAVAGGSFTLAGAPLDCPPEKNLVLRALMRLESYIGHPLPPLDIILEKHIPSGAGLGGGSSDAAFALVGANAVLGIGLSADELATLAAEVGSDCPFFIYNRPMLATGRGEVLSGIECTALKGKGILIAKPQTESVSTGQAYAAVTTRTLPDVADWRNALMLAATQWHGSDLHINDFEQAIFPLRPAIADIKKRMTAAGAIYSAMSGSGASVFGIFADVKMAETAAGLFGDCDCRTAAADWQPSPPNVLPPASL